MRIDPGLLPYVDQHSTEVDSPPDRVWEKLSRFAVTLSYFAIGASDPPRELVLRAEFPGPKGSVYRALVIGTRIHVLASRGILARVKARAERA
jgi:hypothetical protein